MPQLLGKEIGATGFGLMGLTWRANPQPEEESFKAMRASLAAGANFWNGGEASSVPSSKDIPR
jgi:pyridoxine 4-dehydrogenase